MIQLIRVDRTLAADAAWSDGGYVCRIPIRDGYTIAFSKNAVKYGESQQFVKIISFSKIRNQKISYMCMNKIIITQPLYMEEGFVIFIF